jgi:hypothetical protein
MQRHTIRKTVLVALAAAAGALFLPLSCTQIKHAQLALARDESRAQRDALLADLAAREQPAWAGEYMHLTGRETEHFAVSSNAFWFEHRHCTGIGELAYGSVERVDGARLVLAPRFHREMREERVREPGGRREFQFERELYVVPWGAETFLVPASLMQEFCALATASSWNSMHYATYPRKRRGEELAFFGADNLVGLPDVPEQFRRYLPR